MTQSALQATQQWVERVVIGLNLCPFAKREWLQDRVRLQVSDADTHEGLLQDLMVELALLKRSSKIETTLLVHPCVLTDFDEYNQFLDFVDTVVAQMSLDGVFQIASFHPNYQFADTHVDDVGNYTNRSPYPMLHILREDSLERAIDTHPDTGAIPQHNIDLLRRLGTDHIASLMTAPNDQYS